MVNVCGESVKGLSAKSLTQETTETDNPINLKRIGWNILTKPHAEKIV